MTTKIHAEVSGVGNLIRLTSTPGQRNDITGAETLIENLQPQYVIADKGYDSDELRSHIRRSGAKPVIPSRKAIRRRRYDKTQYKLRNTVERFFKRLKHFRRIATRYEKTDTSFLGFLTLAAATLKPI